MKNTDYAKALARRAAADARCRRLEPLVVVPRAVQNWPPFPFPYLSDHIPDGWRPGKTYVVNNDYFNKDSTGSISQQTFQEILAQRAVSDRIYGYGVLLIEKSVSHIVEYVRC